MKSGQKSRYLIVFIVLVLMMISLGGLTRLTRSGLSIVEWKPVSGLIPPLSNNEWQRQFDLYQKTPEYNQVNQHFGLTEYKTIFLWEYSHRLLGRLIFLYTAIGGIWLWKRKKIEGKVVLTLCSVIILQGFAGWTMVKSGLDKVPHVSPYFLALHYFLALFALSLAYFYLSKMRSPIPTAWRLRDRLLWWGLGLALTAQIFYGCLTSGLKAGFAFNTFPLMGNSILPGAGFNLLPSWINFFENPILVQFIHRWLGISVFLLTLAALVILGRPSRSGRRGPFLHLFGITFAQVILGISTLLMGVPILIATLHQLIAALIVLGYLNICFRKHESKVL